MAAKKHEVRVLMTSPLGRPGDVVRVTKDTPHLERWLNNGVVEYVAEVDDEGRGQDGPQGGRGGVGESGQGGEPEGGGEDG